MTTNDEPAGVVSRSIRQETQGPVMGFMRANPDKPLSVNDVARRTHTKPSAVSAVLRRMPGVAAVPDYGRGWYVYSPNGAAAPSSRTGAVGDVYEAVGFTRDGQIVVKDEAGTLWTVVPL